MPKKLLATTIIIVLAIEILSMSIVSANFTPGPNVYIASPRDRYIYPWITYEKTCIPLEIRVVVPESSLPIPRVLYSIDGEANITLTNITNTHTYWGRDFYQVTLDSNLTNLSEGNHTLSAYSFGSKGEALSYTRNFAVGNSTFYSEPTGLFHPPPRETPSQGMPTINTGPTLPVELNPSIVYFILAAVIVIVAIASISLVYFKKRSQKLGGKA